MPTIKVQCLVKECTHNKNGVCTSVLLSILQDGKCSLAPIPDQNIGPITEWEDLE